MSDPGSRNDIPSWVIEGYELRPLAGSGNTAGKELTETKVRGDLTEPQSVIHKTTSMAAEVDNAQNVFPDHVALNPKLIRAIVELPRDPVF